MTVSVQAGDLQEDGSEGSGLADEAYSFDGGSSWQGNTYTYMENGSYLIKVRDILGNTEEKEFNIRTIDRMAPKITVAQDTQANALTNTVTISAEDLQRTENQAADWLKRHIPLTEEKRGVPIMSLS